MTKNMMTREKECEFDAKPGDQEPQGPGRRRKRPNLTEVAPVRFLSEILEKARQPAEVGDRSVSSWFRRAVVHELEQQSG